jgi:phage tail-like protein
MTTCMTEDTRFLVLNKRAAWERGLAVGLQVGDDGLRLVESRRFSAQVSGPPATPRGAVTVVDFAVGACDLLYLLDTTARRVWTYDPTLQHSEPIARMTGPFADAVSVAYAPGTLFLGHRDAPARILALADLNWQVRWSVGAELDAAGRPLGLDGPLTPIDLAADRHGNLYVLTLLAAPASGDGTVPAGALLAIVKLDRGGRVVAVMRPPTLTLGAATPLADLPKHLFLIATPDGAICVLDAPGRRVLRISAAGVVELDFPVDRRRAEDPATRYDIEPAGLGADTDGNLYVGDRRTLDPGEEDDRFIRVFDARGRYRGEVFGYRGPVEQLAVGQSDRIFVLTPARELVVLRPERTFSTGSAAPRGLYFSRALDSTALGTRWHRLAVEAVIPENTQVRVFHLVSDDKQFPLGGQRDLDGYLESLHAPDLTPEALQQAVGRLDALPWSSPPLTNPSDALIRAEAGRFLWLRIELIGSAVQTPTVSSVRAWFPRTSYLRYLPAIYQEDEASRDFLERFLSIFETLLSGVEEQIGHVGRLFDVDATADEFLRWLASWLAIAADESWPPDRLRALMRAAPQLYRQRGTRAGLEAIVELLTGERPLIFEQLQLACIESDQVRQIFQRLFGDDPYCFCVLFPPDPCYDREHPRAAERLVGHDREWYRSAVRLVEAEKPAHTCAGVQLLQPWVQLDLHTYLGINTYLSRPTPRLGSGASMPHDTVLGDVPEAGQIERRSRLGLDTALS